MRTIDSTALLHVLSRLEDDVLHVQAWADALKAIGDSPNLLQPASIMVIGNVLDTLAGELRDRWEEARTLVISSK